MTCLDYTENCYSCKYAQINRVSDVTIGDSWGSDLVTEKEKGISLFLCQSEKGKWLLDISDIHIEPVDIKRAVEYNQQLMHPAVIPEMRERFFVLIKNGKKFNKAFSKCYPKVYYKQKLKRLLIELGIIKGKTNQ